MTMISPLQNIHSEGSYGNFENKTENELLKISELKNLLIVQIVQYKNSSIKINDIKLNNLQFVNLLPAPANKLTLWPFSIRDSNKILNILSEPP